MNDKYEKKFPQVGMKSALYSCTPERTHCVSSTLPFPGFFVCTGSKPDREPNLIEIIPPVFGSIHGRTGGSVV